MEKIAGMYHEDNTVSYEKMIVVLATILAKRNGNMKVIELAHLLSKNQNTKDENQVKRKSESENSIIDYFVKHRSEITKDDISEKAAGRSMLIIMIYPVIEYLDEKDMQAIMGAFLAAE
jgi:hypothetical protein